MPGREAPVDPVIVPRAVIIDDQAGPVPPDVVHPDPVSIQRVFAVVVALVSFPVPHHVGDQPVVPRELALNHQVPPPAVVPPLTHVNVVAAVVVRVERAGVAGLAEDEGISRGGVASSSGAAQVLGVVAAVVAVGVDVGGGVAVPVVLSVVIGLFPVVVVGVVGVDQGHAQDQEKTWGGDYSSSHFVEIDINRHRGSNLFPMLLEKRLWNLLWICRVVREISRHVDPAGSKSDSQLSQDYQDVTAVGIVIIIISGIKCLARVPAIVAPSFSTSYSLC